MSNVVRDSLVSIVVTIYNQEKYLEFCLQTILNQTYKNLQIICVNDGSTDSSSRILDMMAQKDERLQVIHQENAGAGKARNEGFKHVTGDYVLFLDGDDFFQPTMVEVALEKALSDDLDAVVFMSNSYNEQHNQFEATPWVIRHDLLPNQEVFCANDVAFDFFSSFIWWAWDKLFRVDFLRKTGLEFQSLRTTNDLYFTVCNMLLAPRIGIVNTVLAHQRVSVKTSLSATRELSWHCFYEALRAMKEFLVSHNFYERFERDFVNYCMTFSMWQVNTITGKSYELLFNKLQQEWFDEMSVTKFSPDYFYNQAVWMDFNYLMNHKAEEYLLYLQNK